MAVNFEQLVNDLLSSTLGGQQRLFNQFLATDPRFRHVTPVVQRGLEQQFDPLSAKFLLGAGAGGGASDFSKYVSQNFGLPTGGSFQNDLSGVRGLFGEQQLSPEDEARRRLLEDDQFGRQIIEQNYASQVNPILRQFIPDILNRRFAIAQHKHPEQSLFRQFVADNFGFPEL